MKKIIRKYMKANQNWISEVSLVIKSNDTPTLCVGELHCFVINAKNALKKSVEIYNAFACTAFDLLLRNEYNCIYGRIEATD